MSGVRRKRGQKNVSNKGNSTGVDFTFNEDDTGDARDYDIESENDDDENQRNEEDSSSSDEEETVDAKRIRLAREILKKVEKDEIDHESSDNDDEMSVDDNVEGEDKVAKRLMTERQRRQGTLEQFVASKVSKHVSDTWKRLPSISNDVRAEAKEWVDSGQVKLLRGHDLTPTCVALHEPSGSVAFSASKDSSIIMWDTQRESKMTIVKPQWRYTENGHTRNSGEILAMACSDDGRYLAAGGRDTTVQIFDVRISGINGKNICAKNSSITSVAKFEGHKSAVSALAFRKQSLQLFSGSDDRCIRHYSLGELAYVETLYGHQAAVTGISCFRNEIPLSVGRDRTARAWKLAEETHFIYRGGSKVSYADCISSISDEWWLTGHNDGVLSLWMQGKKKAAATIFSSHGCYGEGGKGVLPRGVTSCASLGGSDIAATGSSDGYLRLWKVSTGNIVDGKNLEQLAKVPLYGYINDIAFGPNAKFCVAAIGQEPRLGRWDRVQGAKNRFAIIKLDEGNDNESRQVLTTDEE